jgi:hypothetical protein
MNYKNGETSEIINIKIKENITSDYIKYISIKIDISQKLYKYKT